ncbi:DUF2306 domain-containing protein [Sphaerisporangium rubeum]|uniref:DUF2306 domain-containing protein n=1 Tax=Sphaerisporangium rubeum TaxID=321317 RepID=A0A7X0IHM6_9ACTN|nr:DUF2306 domain-containing protein [Sphaerisporangium rubeum]MBB6474834.1 hypothetical protein [Sphaerisporangium rubeum]
MTTPLLTGNPARRPRARSGWRLAAALVLLAAVPLIAGTLRLLQLAGGPELIPADHRFDTVPIPVAAHITGSVVYALAGALQFVPRFRRSHPRWHRRTGRLLVAAGLVVATSALWMTLTYPTKPGTGDLLFASRLVAGTAMTACLVLGFTAARRRAFTSHRAWMIRAYALALAAGTQAFTEGIGGAVFGHSVLVADLSKAAAWVINLAVAEWAIHRQKPTTALRP